MIFSISNPNSVIVRNCSSLEELLMRDEVVRLTFKSCPIRSLGGSPLPLCLREIAIVDCNHLNSLAGVVLPRNLEVLRFSEALPTAMGQQRFLSMCNEIREGSVSRAADSPPTLLNVYIEDIKYLQMWLPAQSSLPN